MRVSVEFQDEQFELDLPDEMLVGLWKGPAGVPGKRRSRRYVTRWSTRLIFLPSGRPSCRATASPSRWIIAGRDRARTERPG